VPVQSLEVLIREVETKRRKPVKDISELQFKLQTQIEENERLREEIRDERRKNVARGRRMQQMVADMKRQIAQASEESAWEEEKMVTLIGASMQLSQTD
jgi:DNA polymerase/3'-5' exonuclease PolX